MSWLSKKPCAVCEEKDRRIADLYRLVEDYRRLALPAHSKELSPAQREADLLLNPDTNHADISDVEYEAAALLSGNWDNYAVDVS